MQQDIYDIIIIGAGVAGLTAAVYALRAGKTVLVLESKVAGGQIVQVADVRNWPGATQISGEQLSHNLYQQAKALGAQFAFDTATAVKAAPHVFTVRTGDDDDGETYTARTLILAVGSHDKPLGLADEEKYLNHGLSYCATCDGALYRDQDIAVIGGGNTAFYDVLYLANLARKVYLVHRRQAFRADAILVEKVKRLRNVEFVLGMVPVAIEGDERVEKLVLKPNQNATTSESHQNDSVVAAASEHHDGTNALEMRQDATTPRTLAVTGIFVAIGREPSTQIFRDLVALDQDGHIRASEDCLSSQPGVFAAGDCRTKSVRQLVTAAADGAVAATTAVAYLNEQ